MFVYEKRLQYPIKITHPNPRLAKIIMSQYGGPDGELGASVRYLSQRFTMPYRELQGLLTDIGSDVTEMLQNEHAKNVESTRLLLHTIHSRERIPKHNNSNSAYDKPPKDLKQGDMRTIRIFAK
jgi:spore coat protein JC